MNTSLDQRPTVTVAALVLSPAGHILLLEGAKWGGRLSLPGGKVEFGESLEDALRREIREETALEVYDLQFLMVQELIHEPEFEGDCHFLSVNYVCRTDETHVELNEEAGGHRWSAPAEALSQPLNRPTRALVEAWTRCPNPAAASRDRIVIEDLEVSCIIGMWERERRHEQPLMITMELATSTKQAAGRERLEETIDYEKVSADTVRLAREGHYHLLETLAEDVATYLLVETSAVEATVRIRKPLAIPGARGAAVQITRNAYDYA